MRTRRVAIDVNMPRRLVRMLNTGFGAQGFEFVYETEFAEARDEDEFWATAFRRFGGEVVLSGDKFIAKKPHQIIAFKQNNLICFFCESRWGNADVTFKVAHMIYWWPRIQNHLEACSPRDCWWVPMPVHAAEFAKGRAPAKCRSRSGRSQKVSISASSKPPATSNATRTRGGSRKS